jgi:CBS-domain-containing membrane protein
MDFAEAAARVPVGEVMRRDFLAVTADVALETLVTLLIEADAGSAPVVDARGGVVGVVTKADLLRLRPESDITERAAPASLGRGFHVEVPGGLTARDVMTPCAYVIPDHARLSHAIGLLASARIGHVPVVDAQGALVGVLDRADVIAWLARELGYEPLPRLP